MFADMSAGYLNDNKRATFNLHLENKSRKLTAKAKTWRKWISNAVLFRFLCMDQRNQNELVEKLQWNRNFAFSRIKDQYWTASWNFFIHTLKRALLAICIYFGFERSRMWQIKSTLRQLNVWASRWKSYIYCIRRASNASDIEMVVENVYKCRCRKSDWIMDGTININILVIQDKMKQMANAWIFYFDSDESGPAINFG